MAFQTDLIYQTVPYFCSDVTCIIIIPTSQISVITVTRFFFAEDHFAFYSSLPFLPLGRLLDSKESHFVLVHILLYWMELFVMIGAKNVCEKNKSFLHDT